MMSLALSGTPSNESRHVNIEILDLWLLISELVDIQS